MSETMPTGVPTPKEIILSAAEQKELQKKLNHLTEEIFSMTPGMFDPKRITKEEFQNLPQEEKANYESIGDMDGSGKDTYEYSGVGANDLYDEVGNINKNNQLSGQESYDYFNEAKGCAKMIIEGKAWSKLPEETHESHKENKDMTVTNHDSCDKEPIGTIEYQGKKFDIFKGESYKTNNQFSGGYDNQVYLIPVEKK